MNSIQESFTDKLFANYEANVKYQAIENAASHNGIFAALERRQSHVDNTPVFSLDLTKDKVTNQKASGRCWMFAALNTFRHKLISQYKLENFELSQAHTFFWDKYEKSNWFLEQAVAVSSMQSLINCFVKMLKFCVIFWLLAQTKRLFKLRKKTSCKKSLTSLPCH